MDRNTLLLILAVIAIGLVILFLLPRPEGPRAKPIVENADYVDELTWGRIPIEPKAAPRTLVEYPNAAINSPLIKAPSELEEKATAVLARPLIEYSDSALSSSLEEPEVRPVALPRPLVEYSNSATVFVLEQPMGADFGQVQPRPLVEFADGGWVTSLSSPFGFLKDGK